MMMFITEYYWDHKIKQNDVGEACWKREMHSKLRTENLKGKDHLGNVGVERWEILKWVLKI
jgi:hypothetical protein